MQTLPHPPVSEQDRPPCPVIPIQGRRPREEEERARFDAEFIRQLRIRGLLPPAS
jgi:hypothetical protein